MRGSTFRRAFIDAVLQEEPLAPPASDLSDTLKTMQLIELINGDGQNPLSQAAKSRWEQFVICRRVMRDMTASILLSRKDMFGGGL